MCRTGRRSESCNSRSSFDTVSWLPHSKHWLLLTTHHSPLTTHYSLLSTHRSEVSLPTLSIRRHVFAAMLSIVLVLFGLIGYQRIGVDRYPQVEFPLVSVVTVLPGANPEIVDTSVTGVIESAVNAIPGIDFVASTSQPGVSQVVMQFDLSKNIDVAFNEVQAKVNTVLRQLPDDADPPVVAKVEFGADPVLWLALQGDRTIAQLNQYARNTIKKRLETIDGVGQVLLGGRRDRSIRVDLDLERMAAFKVDARDLRTAFAREHLSLPGGFVVGERTEQLLELDLEYHQPEALGELVVRYADPLPVRLKDIATIHDDLADFRQVARVNGEPAIGIGIVKVSNGNTVAIVDDVLARLERDIRPQLPAGMTLEVVVDSSQPIREIVASLQDHLIEGTILAALVVWLFLQSLRSTLIISLAIPVSLLGAVAVMYFAGYTFNTMTLLALLLLIGVVVDDAIVVLENVHRHLEFDRDVGREGEEAEAGLGAGGCGAGAESRASPQSAQGAHAAPPGDTPFSRAHAPAPSPQPRIPEATSPRSSAAARTVAAIRGSNEVVFAVTAASLTLVSIFAAVIFLGGIIGRFFESFAVVVTVGVVVSLLVSLTLTPMLCSRFLTVGEHHGRISGPVMAFFARMDAVYAALVDWALAHRWKVVAIGLAVVAASALVVGRLGGEFSPQPDDGRFVVSFRTPLGSSITQTDEALRAIEQALQDTPEVARMFTAIGLGDLGQVNRGIASVTMHPRSERARSQSEVIEDLRGRLAAIPGIKAFVSPPPTVGGGNNRGEPLQFNVSGPDLNEVARAAQALFARLAERPELGRVDLDLNLDLPTLRLSVDRTRAAAAGLGSVDIASALNVLAGGLDVAKYSDDPGDGERYDIRVKAAPGQIESAQDLKRIYLRASSGAMVRLDTVATLTATLGPAAINRYDLKYSANFYATPTGVTLSEAVATMREVAAEVLPVGIEVKLMAQAREFEKTLGYIQFSFILAVALVYIVLASQFNSLIQPLIVMVAQPLAIIGGLIALWVTGHTLNIYSMIGLVLLMGLVAKNSILLVDLANQLREQGKAIDEALREACPKRLRPVLMTSLTVILALLPAALGVGAGADVNAPLAVAVIGGMISSTLLTLVVVPSVYSLVERALARRSGA
ncbi:MAG: Multidrug/solvent efflux pump membrane transporter MepB [Xanthomonadales bacterium]|nr:Multidrug/solvent efflux pump membrane transporter MepB [Xanthomonadales bacterium]